jgi:hypothetical protein
VSEWPATYNYKSVTFSSNSKHNNKRRGHDHQQQQQQQQYQESATRHNDEPFSFPSPFTLKE